ncbi:MAG: MobA/MobL family protein, partial [Cyanobacteria bacterium]|nr:MobA/MobL family protein [Cyanobacteriota bacterium]
MRALAYIAAIKLSDQLTGEKFNFGKKMAEDVQILLPESSPLWAREIQRLVSEDKEQGLQVLSDMVNGAEKRIDAQLYREVEFSLPRELTFEQNKALSQEYVQDQFCSLGMLAIQSFHVEKSEKTGELNPHCHTFLLTRDLTDDGLSPKKNREWNSRELHEGWREQWAQYASFHLKMYGYDITLDHRSYKDQGLGIEPQIKLGKPSLEQERRAHLKVEPQPALQRQGEGRETEGGSKKALGFVEE